MDLNVATLQATTSFDEFINLSESVISVCVDYEMYDLFKSYADLHPRMKMR